MVTLRIPKKSDSCAWQTSESKETTKIAALMVGQRSAKGDKCEVLWRLRVKLWRLQTSRRRKSEDESGEGTDGSCNHIFLRHGTPDSFPNDPIRSRLVLCSFTEILTVTLQRLTNNGKTCSNEVTPKLTMTMQALYKPNW
jgi:hypothetical protein